MRTEDEVGRRGWWTARTEMMEVEEEDKDGMKDRGGGDKNREISIMQCRYCIDIYQ